MTDTPAEAYETAFQITEELLNLVAAFEEVRHIGGGFCSSVMTRGEVDRFLQLDERLYLALHSIDLRDELPSIETLGRHLDSPDGRPVQFEGKCHLPGDWEDGLFMLVTEPWLREMKPLRALLSSRSVPAVPCPQELHDGQLVDEEDVPAEFRNGAEPDGIPLTPPNLRKLNWGLHGREITEAHDDNRLTKRIRVRTKQRGKNPYAYLYQELLVLRERKTRREDQRDPT